MVLRTRKQRSLAELLNSSIVSASVAGSRLLGPLAVLNNKGMVVSRLADDEEVRHLSSVTGLKCNEARVPLYVRGKSDSRPTITERIISDVFSEESAKDVERILEVPVKRIRIGNYIQVGAMISCTNSGAIIHPIATEEEINIIGKILGFDPEPATVNGGVPFVGSGFVGNSKSILVGALTRGSELVILGRAFG